MASKRFWVIVVCLYLAGAVATYSLLAGRYLVKAYGMPSLAPLLAIGRRASAVLPREPEPTPLHTYTELSPLEIRHLLNGNCQTVRSTEELPAPVRKAFATITHEKLFELADPGAPFNQAGVIDPHLPTRRLNLAGRCDDRWFIEYQHGGQVQSTALMVLRVETGQSAAFIWGRALRVRQPSEENFPKDLDDLRAALASEAFRDEPYRW